jgi:hypothetical protein
MSMSTSWQVKGLTTQFVNPSQTSRGCIGVEEAFAELAVPHSAGNHADAVRRSA